MVRTVNRSGRHAARVERHRYPVTDPDPPARHRHERGWGRALHPEGGHYTFWDYFGSWERNNGIRIDHLLLSPQALDRLTKAGIDKEVRGASEKPSDHVPVWVELSI